jgi:hypothetical protein
MARACSTQGRNEICIQNFSLLGKKKPLEIPWRRLNDNIKICLELGCQGVNCAQLVQDQDQ